MQHPVPLLYAKAELVRRGISQKDLAARYGASQAFVSEVLGGHKSAPERFRRIIAELTGLPERELFR